MRITDLVRRPGLSAPGWWWVVAIVLVLLSALQYLWVQGHRNLMPDESIYSYVGWAWAHGDRLYRDAWDHKGPVVFAVTAARTALFGNSPALVGVQEVVLAFFTALGCAAAAARLWGPNIGAAVLVLATLAWSHVGPAGGQVSTAGSIIALLTAAGIYTLVRMAQAVDVRRALYLSFLFGVLQGLLFAAKPNAIVTSPLILLGAAASPALRKHLTLSASAAIGGAVLVILAIGTAFALQGTFGDFVDAAYLFNVTRARAAYDDRGFFAVAVSMARLLRGLNVHALLVAVFVSWILAYVVSRPERESSRALLTWHLAPSWVGLELVALVSNSAYTHHVFTLLFALAFGAGQLLHFAGTASPDPARASAVRGCVALLVATPWITLMAGLDRVTTVPRYEQVAAYIAETTDPSERVLHFPGWYGAAVLFLAERKTANRFMTPLGLQLMGIASDARWNDFANTLTGPNAVRTVLADLYGRPEWASADSLPQLVQRLDTFLSNLAAAPGPFPARERAKELLVANYRVERCFHDLCVLRRRPLTE